MIYEYTKQDIPKAWRAGYWFVERDVVPRLMRSSPVSGSDLLRSGDPSTLKFRASLFSLEDEVFDVMEGDLAETIVLNGTPLRELNETERTRYEVYRTLFSALGSSPDRFNLHAGPIGDAFGGVSPPDRVEMPEGLSGGALAHELIRRMTPVMSFHVPEDVYENIPSKERGVDGSWSQSATWRLMSPVVIGAHEFAHATLQPGLMMPPSHVLRLMDDSSRVSDTLMNFTVMQHFMREIQADLFSAAVSLVPKAWVSMRHGTYASAKGLAPTDKVDLVVVSPEEVENPDSPLYSHLRQMLDEQTSFVNNPITEDDQGMKALYDAHLQEARTGTVEGLLVFSKMLTQMPSTFLSMAHGKTQVADLITMQGSRALSISYAVGKSRPDLIGKTVQIDAEGNIITPSGEVIDPADILPDIPIIGMHEPEEIHPVLMERAFQAQEIYNRAREAIRQGYRFEPPPIQAADVVNTWRQEFERIVR